MTVIQYYKTPGLSHGATAVKVDALKDIISNITNLKTELCFNIEVKQPLDKAEEGRLLWILGSPYHPQNIRNSPFLDEKNGDIIEIGPRYVFNFLITYYE